MPRWPVCVWLEKVHHVAWAPGLLGEHVERGREEGAHINTYFSHTKSCSTQVLATYILIPNNHKHQNRLDAGRVFRPLHTPGATGGEPGLKQQQQQQQKQQQQQPGLRTAKLDEETQPRARDAAAAAAAKAAGSRASAAAAAGLPLNAQQQQQEQPQPPAPRSFAAMKKKEETLPTFFSDSAEAKDSIAGSSSSSSSLPSSSSAVPPRQLQQTIDHLAKRAPAPLEPKVIRPVSKKEGSAWAEKTTKKEGRAFSKFGGEGKKSTAEEEEEEEEEEKGGEKVGVEVDAEGKLTAAVTEEQEKMTKKKGRGPIRAVGDFLFGKGGGKAQGTKEDEVEKREEQGREKQKVWGSRISSNGAVMTKEEMEAERAAAAAAAEELAASRVEKEGKEEMEKGMEAGEESAAVGAKWMKKGHAAVHVGEE